MSSLALPMPPTGNGAIGESLAERVYGQLKEDILRVARKPGQVVLEAELATQYGVSKTPVREALRLLAKDGWVVVLPRKGYLIRPLRVDDVREVFALRRLLEPAFATQTARLALPADLATLRAVVAAQAASDTDAALAWARDFHLALTDIVGNGRGRVVLSGLLDEVRRLHYLMPNVEGHITSTEELQAHERLLTAFETGDGDRAANLMHAHLDEVARTLINAFAGVTGAD